MSSEKESHEQKMDLSKLGQFYSPIDFIEYGHTQASSDINNVSPLNKKLPKLLFLLLTSMICLTLIIILI